VVNDGSTDRTRAFLDKITAGFSMTVLHLDRNSGVSAGRNAGIAASRGTYLILLSDDLVVPPDFISRHLRTLDRFPDSWVVGGFRQLDSLTDSPFGRYLDRLESSFEEARKDRRHDTDVWEMTWPTARNLSLRRTDLETTGLFDERFRTTCEDQDLAERARAAGIRFVYDASIDCLHNDQAGDLDRYCRFQEAGASDTVLYVAKSPILHAGAPVARLNGPLRRSEGPVLLLRKATKASLATTAFQAALRRIVRIAEALRVPDRALGRLYRLMIGTAIWRGWRAGLRIWGDPAAPRTQQAVATGTPAAVPNLPPLDGAQRADV